MLKKRYIVSIMLVLLISMNIVTYGKTEMIVDKGNVGSSYTLKFNEGKAMLTRDGSIPVSVKSGTTIIKSGDYFLSTVDTKGMLTITHFRVDSIAPKIINNKDDLKEAVKAGLEKFQPEITLKFSYGDFDINKLNELVSGCVDGVLDEYPKLTFENYTLISTGGQKPSIKLKITYPDNNIATLKKYDEQLNSKIIPILKKVLKPTMSPYEREWAIYDYLAKNITYDHNFLSNKIHTMQGALVDNKAVCDGYAKTFMYLLNATGIETRKVIGTGKGIPHAWNIIKIEGQYYHVDVTFGDADSNQIGNFYDYFNETDNYMSETHEWDRKKYPTCDSYKRSLMYLPLSIEEIYKVDSKDNWYKTCMTIKTNKSKSGSIILYDNKNNNWDVNQVISQLVNVLGGTIYYNTVDKYNGIVVNWAVERAVDS